MVSRFGNGLVALLLLLLAGSAIAVIGALIVTNGEFDVLGMVARSPLPTPIHINPTTIPGTINPPADQIRDPAPLNRVVPRRPLFEQIPLPQEFNQQYEVIATNLFLALLLVMGIGSASAVLNSLVRRYPESLGRWRPRWLVKGYRSAVRRGLLGLPIILVVFALYGIIFAFLEPGQSIFGPTGKQLALLLAISVALVSFGGDIARRWVARLWPRREAYGLYPANLLVAVLTTIFSRLCGLAPGILFGVPGGADIEFEGDQVRAREIVLAIVTLIAVLVLGGLGWALAAGIAEAGKTTLQPESLRYLGPIAQLFQTLGLAIFAVAVQTAFFEMLPLTARSGARLFRWSPLIWSAVLLPVTFIFAHTTINPNGDLRAAINTPNVQVALVLLDVLATVTLLVWLYFALIAPFFTPRKSIMVGESGVPWYVPPPRQTFQPPVQPPVTPAIQQQVYSPHAVVPDWMLDTAIPYYEEVEDDDSSVQATRPVQRVVAPMTDTRPVNRQLTPTVYDGLFPPPAPGDEDYLESDSTSISVQLDTAKPARAESNVSTEPAAPVVPTIPAADSDESPTTIMERKPEAPETTPPDSLPL